MTIQLALPTVPVMTVQVVGGELYGPWFPPDQGLPSTPVSRVELNTAGFTWVNLISMKATPFIIASGGIVTFWLMIVPSMKLTVAPGKTGNGPTVTVFVAGPIATPKGLLPTETDVVCVLLAVLITSAVSHSESAT
jgi:hypothetical protein